MRQVKDDDALDGPTAIELARLEQEREPVNFVFRAA
jgi:hypothetical protein